MKRKRVTVADLTDQTGTNGLVLYCPKCECSWSANSGDYFQAPLDHVFRCVDCKGKPYLKLGLPHQGYHEVALG